MHWQVTLKQSRFLQSVSFTCCRQKCTTKRIKFSKMYFQERSINLQRFNAEEWRLKRCRQKTMNLIGVDENTRRILASSDDSNSDILKNDKSSQNSFSKNGSSSSEKSDFSSNGRTTTTNPIQSETLPQPYRSATTQKVACEEVNIPGSKIKWNLLNVITLSVLISRLLCSY